MSYKKSQSFIIITLVVACLAGLGGYLGGRHLQPPQTPTSSQTAERPPAAHEDADGHGADDGHGHGAEDSDKDHAPSHAAETALAAGHKAEGDAPTGHAEEGHGADDGHGAEVSDLDRPVDEMWSARCEHDILHYQCDECRYELGVVKLDPSLLAANDLVRAGRPEKRQSHQEKRKRLSAGQLAETRDWTWA